METETTENVTKKGKNVSHATKFVAMCRVQKNAFRDMCIRAFSLDAKNVNDALIDATKNATGTTFARVVTWGKNESKGTKKKNVTRDDVLRAIASQRNAYVDAIAFYALHVDAMSERDRARCDDAIRAYFARVPSDVIRDARALIVDRNDTTTRVRRVKNDVDA